MSALFNEHNRRSLAITIGAVLIAGLAAIVLRQPLATWFTGKPMGDAAGPAVTAHTGPFTIEARLAPDPPREKDQELLLTVQDATGKPVDGATVEVVYDMPAMGAMAEMKGGAQITRAGEGAYRARFDLPMASTWALRVSVHEGSRSASQGFQMTVGSSGVTLIGGGGGSTGEPGIAVVAPPASSGGSIDHYTCSMHPSVKQSQPGTCPICGMNLVAVTSEQQEQGVVMIDDVRRQLIGVRTEPVVTAPMQSTFRAVGHVAYDESALADVNLKVRGWITKLYVNETGQRVSKGQILFTIYSPELYNAEQDFLLGVQGAAVTASGGDQGPRRTDLLAHAARQRLHLLGLTDAQIDAIAQSGKPSEDVAIASPASGFVIEKNVVEGASVDAGMRLYRIAALSKVWVDADVYESDLAHARAGQRATITLDYLPGRAYEAKVAYVYPYLDPASRTGRVRLELANRDLDLRPGMYASVTLAADLGVRVQVPVAAVVYTGPRRLVFADLGGGHFRPTEVQVGIESNGMYEVISGLSPGDQVATSGVFLIAAEARISTAAKYWDSTSDMKDAGVAASEGMAPGSPMVGPRLSMPMRAATDLTMPMAPNAARTTPMMPSAAPTPSMAASASPRTPAAAGAPGTVDYQCPMHPEVHSGAPGKCPKCGMELEPHPRQP